MARRVRSAILGGTFDRLHAGHLALLDAAFATAREVRIGLTSRSYLAEHPKPLAERLRPFGVRRRALAALLRRRYPAARFSIRPIDDRYGGALQPGIDRLVLSEETAAAGRAVNRARRRRGLPPLGLVVIPLVRAEDLGPIEGRRIRAGVIDRRGHRLGALRIVVRADSPRLSRELAELARAVWPMRRVRIAGPRAIGRSPRRGMIELTASSRPGRPVRVLLASDQAPPVQASWTRAGQPPGFGGLGPYLPSVPPRRGRGRRPAARPPRALDNH